MCYKKINHFKKLWDQIIVLKNVGMKLHFFKINLGQK